MCGSSASCAYGSGGSVKAMAVSPGGSSTVGRPEEYPGAPRVPAALGLRRGRPRVRGAGRGVRRSTRPRLPALAPPADDAGEDREEDDEDDDLLDVLLDPRD